MLGIIQRLCAGTSLLSHGVSLKQFIKLDVDDSSLRNPERIEFGSLLKFFEGRWLMGFTGYRGFGSNLLPKLQAIKYSLLVAWDRGFKKAIYNSDSTYIIRLIHDDLELLFFTSKNS